jgi:hypothetical protein
MARSTTWESAEINDLGSMAMCLSPIPSVFPDLPAR